MTSAKKLEVPLPLTAQDKSSFAYKTIKERLPVIIVKTLDFFSRKRRELHTFGGTIREPDEKQLAELEEDSRSFITQMTYLRKDVETNKPLKLLEKIEQLDESLAYFNDDIELWNKALEDNKCQDGSYPLWFESPWLLVESYLYRMIKQASLSTKQLKMFDPFVEQKQAACQASLSQMTVVANHLKQMESMICASPLHKHPSERAEFGVFLQLALWANKSDLSLSAGSAADVKSHELMSNIKESLDDLRENILCDHMSEVWFRVQTIKDRVRSAINLEEIIYIDIVADNAGYEIFVDLCLAHFLTLMFCPISLGSSGVKFRFHLKRMPWYVSDTLRQDIDWLLEYMSGSEQEVLRDLAEKWKSFIDTEFWEMHMHKFWTLPHDYASMKSVAQDLHDTLAQSQLIIFKGDLNYRKLTGDRKWHILTPFKVALREFAPAPLVALRTCKADLVVGIEDVNIFARINNNELPRDWMVSGEYGLIQYLAPS